MSSLDLKTLLGNSELPEQIEQVEFGVARAAATGSSLLREPIERVLAVKGKRLRPSLAVAAAKVIKPSVVSHVITAGVAVELVHIASLVHDDIIDNAATRWNIPTVNTQEGMSVAILVGDLLLARAANQAALVNAEVAQVISATIATLTEGQAYEIDDDHNTHRTMEAYLKSIRGKTAMLMSAACQVGALSVNGTSKQVMALAEYGEYFGMAFQLIDDVLDFISSPEQLGKPIGNDIQEGVYTIPVILALESKQGAEVESLLKDRSVAAKQKLTQILLDGGYIEQTLVEAKKYNQLATNALQDFSDDAVKSLAGLPKAYLKWSIENHVRPEFRKQVTAHIK